MPSWSSYKGLLAYEAILKSEGFTLSHIETRRLFESAEGLIQLDPEEIEHLRECEDCTETLRVFNRQTKDVSPQKKNGTDR